MTKKRILKLTLVVISIIALVFISLWMLVVLPLVQQLNNDHAGKNFTVFPGYTINFSRASPGDFPYSFTILLHNFVEENDRFLITHSTPVRVGYNIFSGKIFVIRKGEAIAKYKPLAANFGKKITGEHGYYAHFPYNFKMIGILQDSKRSFELLNFVKSIGHFAHNVTISNLDNNTPIIKQTNIDAEIKITPNFYYHNYDELIRNIPNDFKLKLDVAINGVKDTTQHIPPSLLCGLYYPYEFSYKGTWDIKTTAKTFLPTEILAGLKIAIDDQYSDSYQNSKSHIKGEIALQDNLRKIIIDGKSTSSLQPSWFVRLRKLLKTAIPAILARSTDNNDPLRFLKHLDFDMLPIADKTTTMENAINLHFEQNLKQVNLNVDLFSINLNGVVIDIANKSMFENIFSWDSSGVVSITEYQKFVNFIAEAYIAMNHLSPLDAEKTRIYENATKKWLEKVASSLNKELNNATVEYQLSADTSKTTKLGSVELPKALLFYYSTLYEESKNNPEMLEQLLPDNIIQNMLK